MKKKISASKGPKKAKFACTLPVAAVKAFKKQLSKKKILEIANNLQKNQHENVVHFC